MLKQSFLESQQLFDPHTYFGAASTLAGGDYKRSESNLKSIFSCKGMLLFLHLTYFLLKKYAAAATPSSNTRGTHLR
jgi:hypothetical protein